MKQRKPRDKSIGHERKWHPRYCPFVIMKLLRTYDETKSVKSVNRMAHKLGVYELVEE